MAETASCGAAAHARVVAADDTLCWPLDVGDPATVAHVRAIVQGALAVLGLGSDAIDDAQRCVAELVGNAACHAWPPVELWLRIRSGAVVIAVVDGNETLPSWPALVSFETAVPPGDPDHLDRIIESLSTSGRGLALVRQLSDGSCGGFLARTRAGAPGKAVWFATSLITGRPDA